jgi:hypothetical protein
MELPISGIEVLMCTPNGKDDLAILEAGGEPVEAALTMLPRLARMIGQDGGEGRDDASATAPWVNLTVTDFDVALLGLHRFLFGDTVACLFRCPSETCGERMEPTFSIAAFLAEVKPSVPKRVKPSEDRAGWFNLSGEGDDAVQFRLPTVGDQVQVLGRPHALQLLSQRCIAAKKLSARSLAQVERAMAAMAPVVSRPVEGSCPECGTAVAMPLHVPSLVMDELRESAAGIHEEIHAIAGTYHWDEATILEMPQIRRRAYADTIRGRERVAV